MVTLLMLPELLFVGKVDDEVDDDDEDEEDEDEDEEDDDEEEEADEDCCPIIIIDVGDEYSSWSKLKCFRTSRTELD